MTSSVSGRVGRSAAIAALMLACVAVQAKDPAPPPNVVEISSRITTSGQPSAAWLEGLKARGYDAVIYLAPSTVPDAVRSEPEIVARQGLQYVNIPIPFNQPGERDFAAFRAAMDSFAGRKVLVHCQVNMRASSMVFLYRTIALHEDPEVAYEPVTKVWVPDGRWKKFIVAELRRNGIGFEPY